MHRPAGLPARRPATATSPTRPHARRHSLAARAPIPDSCWCAAAARPARRPAPAHRPSAGLPAGRATRRHRPPGDGSPATGASCHPRLRWPAPAAADHWRDRGCAGPARTAPRSARRRWLAAPTARSLPHRHRHSAGASRPPARRSAGAGHRAGPAALPAPFAGHRPTSPRGSPAAPTGSSGGATAPAWRRTRPGPAAAALRRWPARAAPPPARRPRPLVRAGPRSGVRRAGAASACGRRGGRGQRSAGSGWNRRRVRRNCRDAPRGAASGLRPRSGRGSSRPRRQALRSRRWPPAPARAAPCGRPCR
ncbi:hypothetical protein LMG26411_08144 [Cupriavidus numazuensis]|uniref:Uncharacterized protein n=1 Tax=Cupriavidus numazuensis TaxID=221992 RepID=A0ABN7QC81_9BURK|nr:hypothetical protein LMG26411_08144 [Cupriavidus numazuensis]